MHWRESLFPLRILLKQLCTGSMSIGQHGWFCPDTTSKPSVDVVLHTAWPDVRVKPWASPPFFLFNSGRGSCRLPALQICHAMPSVFFGVGIRRGEGEGLRGLLFPSQHRESLNRVVGCSPSLPQLPRGHRSQRHGCNGQHLKTASEVRCCRARIHTPYVLYSSTASVG